MNPDEVVRRLQGQSCDDRHDKPAERDEGLKADRPDDEHYLAEHGQRDERDHPVQHDQHGSYAKQTGTITLGDSPTSITLPATSNFDAVLVQYGPK